MSSKILSGILFFLIVASLGMAVSVEYRVQANGIKAIISYAESQVESCSACENSSGNCTAEQVCENQTIITNTTSYEPWSGNRTLSLSCDSTCDYPMPMFNVPDGVDVINYTLWTQGLDPRVLLYFKGTLSGFTADSSDQVHLEVNKSIVCSDIQCDPRCTKCLDGGCYPPAYQCPSTFLKLDRISPNKIDLGDNQITVFVSNMYQVDALQVDAKISGSGIKTLRSTPVERIASKDKDGVVLSVKVDDSGTIDVLVKIMAKVNGEDVDVNGYSQLIVNAPPVAEPPVPVSQSEKDALNQEVEKSKSVLNDLELEYQRKKADGYLVSELYDRVKYIRGLIQEVEGNLLDEKYKDAQKSLTLIGSSLDDLRQALQEAPREQKSLKDIVKDNALLITTVVGALVAVISFWEKNRGRLARLKEKNAESEDEEESSEPRPKKNKWISIEEVKTNKKKGR